MRIVPLLAAATLVAGLLGGCSGAAKDDGPAPRTVLKTAKRNLDATSGVRIGLRTDQLPSGVDGLLSADGIGTHAPAFTGSIKVSAGGINADAEVVATGGKVYAKLPFTSKFAPIDPADYGAPDPASLLAERGGLSSLLTSATDVAAGKQVRDGKRVLTRYTGTVPGSALVSVIPSAKASATFDATFTVDDRSRLARAVLRGPFYPKAGDVSYTVSFSDYGIRRDISAP